MGMWVYWTPYPMLFPQWQAADGDVGVGMPFFFAHSASIPLSSGSSILIYHNRTSLQTFSIHVIWMRLMASKFILSYVVTVRVQGWTLGPGQLDKTQSQDFCKNCGKDRICPSAGL